VRTAREDVRAFGSNHKCRAEQIAKARSALTLAESALREEGKRLGVCITVLEPEQEPGEQMVCARTLKGYSAAE
jgi:hypothetical protein